MSRINSNRSVADIQRDLTRLSSNPISNARAGQGIAQAFGLQQELQFAQQRESNRAFTGATGVDPTSAAIPQSFEQAFALANAKNEERFGQGLALFDQMQANAAQLGQTRREQIRREDIQRQGDITQSQIDRGIFNSTGLNTLEEQQLRNRQFQETALDESLLQETNRILGNRIGFIERRTDAAPDPALFANLQTAASSAPTTIQRFGSGGASFGGGSGTRTTGFGNARSANSPTAGGPQDFAGRQVQPFGQLTFNNAAARNTQRTDQRDQAIANFQSRGISFGGRSRSDIESLLRSVGLTITSADQVNRLSQATINRIKQAMSGQR